MKEVHRKTVAGLRIISVVLVAVGMCLLATCTQSSPGPTGKYVLTIQNNGNCTTAPSGLVSVDAGAPTTIQAIANVGHSWTLTSGWTVVSGTASIVNPSNATTTVTLSAEDATIMASCP